MQGRGGDVAELLALAVIQSQNAIVLPEHLGHHISDARREIVSMRTRTTKPTHHLFASEIHSKVAFESAQKSL